MSSNLISFHHGGRIGDLLYALYTVKAICNITGKKAVLKLSCYHTPGWGLSAIEDLKDLLLGQSYIASIENYDLPDVFYSRPLGIAEGIDFDLHAPERVYNPQYFPEWHGKSWPGNIHMAKRTATHFGIAWSRDLYWIEPLPTYYLPIYVADVVVSYIQRRATRPIVDIIKLCSRLRDKGLSISVVGLEEDTAPFAGNGFNIVPKTSYGNLATSMYYSKAFIGCASSPYVLARGLGVRTYVDLASGCDNNLPLDPKGTDITNLSIEDIESLYEKNRISDSGSQ